MPSSKRRASLEKSASRYEQHVDLARDYLAGRGLARATALSFRLGVVVDPLPGDGPADGRLSIPYLTRSGVVGVRYRCLTDHDHDQHRCPKYWSYAGSESRLYNVAALFGPADFICITEGELDAMVLVQLGLPAVGVPGVANWKKHFSRIFEDYARVFVFADGDEPGQAFGKKVAGEVGAATVIAMPDGMDVNEAFLHDDYGASWLISRTEG